jgi:hypothetical protein
MALETHIREVEDIVDCSYHADDFDTSFFLCTGQATPGRESDPSRWL